MAAMHRTTGKEIVGREEVEQAIDEVLDTYPGDRVMRADYGSKLLTLTDIGMDASGTALLAGSVAGALQKFEPRVVVTKVTREVTPGEVVLTVRGTIKETHEQIVVRK